MSAPEWGGQLDPSAIVRYYLDIAAVEPSLPYPSDGVRLFSTASTSGLPGDSVVHQSFPYFLEIKGRRGGDGMVGLSAALHAALLWCDTSVHPGPRVCYESGYMSVFETKSDFQSHWGHYDAELPTRALDAMNVYGPRLYDLTGVEAFNPLSNALRLYTSGLRMLPSDVALVSFVSALEGLFTTAGDNLSYRLSLAIACLLEPSPLLRLNIFESARRIYTARSKTVHGAHVDRDLERAAITLSENLTPEAEGLCRRCFRAIFELHLDQFMEKDKKGRREELFTLLALGYSLSQARSKLNI